MRGKRKIVPTVQPQGFVVGLAEIGKLLLGQVVMLENKFGRQCALIPARHIVQSQPAKEPEAYHYVCV